ncbi:MAG: hypothetical protein FWC26_10110 [Fibromonadales bacterium]|nr:hypothetical protein [Fibromonadales bacterium]
MKKIILLLVFLAGASFAEKNDALGLWLQGGNSGEYWGVDYKHLGSTAATDIYVHLSASNDKFSLGGYFGYYFVYNIIKADASMGRFPLYWGPVGGVGYWDNGDKIGDDNGVAVRGGVTLGISWIFPTSFPMDVSLELNPVAECHFKSWKDNSAEKHSDTTWEIPSLYFRIMFHAYLF